MKAKAEERTKKAEAELNRYRTIFIDGVKSQPLKWDKLYDHRGFKEAPPIKEDFISKANIPKESLWEMIFSSIREERLKKVNDVERKYQWALAEYEKRKLVFENEVNDTNGRVDLLKRELKEGSSSAIEHFAKLTLDYLDYPKQISKKYQFHFASENRILVVDFELPAPDKIPSTMEFKYVQTRDEIVAKEMKPKEHQGFYDDVIVQLTIRVVYELFRTLPKEHVHSIVFNGWVQGIDKATGQDFRSCIISLQISKEDIEKINFTRVDPKACFRNLKGISASSLAQLAPVKPIYQSCTPSADSRFVESRDILAEINSIPNLAEMEWGDFEHLIRQLFELMFKERGAEVKITRCSRDYGIDAVVYDPDPIFGGKIVIQAKRWNNIVDPSAVRDLWGTMDHEKASKGILVTTSWFGPDSYDWIKDKGSQITLIDGAQLRGLFEQHGFKVRIDLKKKT